MTYSAGQKAAAALRGCKFKDLIEEGLLRVLADETPQKKPKTLQDLMKGACGIIASGVPDLATNPKHMDGFGNE